MPEVTLIKYVAILYVTQFSSSESSSSNAVRYYIHLTDRFQFIRGIFLSAAQPNTVSEPFGGKGVMVRGEGVILKHTSFVS